MRVPAADTGATPDNLIPFFKAKRAFESSLSLFWDKFAPFKETHESSDRARFGPIIKYQFRTRIDRQTESEKVEVQKKLNDPNLDMDTKNQLRDALAKLNQISPPSRDVVSEAFIGLRIAKYDKHYIETCFSDREAATDELVLDSRATARKCDAPNKSYRRIIENNSLPKHYFHIMWGGSEHLQNQDRKLILRRDAQGNPVRDAQGNQIFDLRRGGFTGRVLLEGYLNGSFGGVPLGLRFNGNLGPGEDEIRFSLFVPIELSRLASAFKF